MRTKLLLLLSASVSLLAACSSAHMTGSDPPNSAAPPGADTGDAGAGTDASPARDGNGTSTADTGAPVVDPPGCDVSKDPSQDPCVITEDLAIFVAPSGNDASPGTRAAPKQTLQAGIDAAAAASKRVYACNAVYDEHLTLRTASVYGGLDCTTWSAANGKAIVAPSTMGFAVLGSNVPTQVALVDLDLRAAPATVSGGSSIAVLLDHDAGVVLRRTVVTAAQGAAGANGTSATANPTPAAKGGDASGTAPGVSPACSCASIVNSGGTGGTLSANGMVGLPATSGGGSGGRTATGGGVACTVGGAGRVGDMGATGGRGAGGALSASGWASASGQDGVVGGIGQGGGGGGGYTGSVITPGAAGGAGGCGGCAGGAGTGGAGGGASFGVVAIATPLIVYASQVTAGAGGAGGAGGTGAAGQPGGAGGAHDLVGSCAGGAGGAGGLGGGGAGGAGGPSVAVAWLGVAPTIAVGSVVAVGTGGAGGAGGAAGNEGAPGIASGVQSF